MARPRRKGYRRSTEGNLNLVRGEADDTRPVLPIPRNVLRKPLRLPPMRQIKDERKAA